MVFRHGIRVLSTKRSHEFNSYYSFYLIKIKHKIYSMSLCKFKKNFHLIMYVSELYKVYLVTSSNNNLNY